MSTSLPGDQHVGEQDRADSPVEVELRWVRMTLRRPHVAAHGTEVDREVVLVKVVLPDGITGWGECSALARPTYTSEYTAAAWVVLRDELAPAALAGRPSEVVGHPMATAAVSDALLDARLRRTGLSLSRALGASADRVPTTTVIGIAGTIDDLLGRVEGVTGGIKLKIRPGWDHEPLRAVRSAWPDRWLAADANAGFTSSDLDPLRALDDLGLAYLEQPVRGLVDSASLAGRLDTPICLDESIDTTDAVAVAVAMDAMAVVNVKPSRLGGVEIAREVVAMAVEAGIATFVGGMLETGVGRASAAAVAALDGCTLPTDLGPSSRYFVDDVTPAIVGVDGCLCVPAGPGIGVEPDPDRLDEVTVAGVTLRR